MRAEQNANASPKGYGNWDGVHLCLWKTIALAGMTIAVESQQQINAEDLNSGIHSAATATSGHSP